MKKLLGIASLLLVGACGDGNDEQPRALITNEFASDRTLVTARYADATFDGPLMPGDLTPKKRVRSGLRQSYALAVEGWNGEGDAPVAQVVRSLSGTEAVAERTVTIVYDERASFDKCGGMGKEEYDLINVTFFAKSYAVAPYEDVVCPLRLLAISDLHLGVASNRAALTELPDHGDDWLIVAGDVGEKLEQVDFAMGLLTTKFARVFGPRNHELWSTDEGEGMVRGVAKYEAMVEVCRKHGVPTPEDPYTLWPGSNIRIAPIFTLFDYSFKPDDVALADAVEWAASTNVVSADEMYLKPEPFATRAEWCAERCRLTERRLAQVSRDERLILIGHFPLVKEIVRLRYIERFVIWCGTTLTRDWHTRFNVDTVVYGHLHVRSTQWRDGVRFEECALGMKRQWHADRGVEGYLREILPGPLERPPGGNAAPVYKP